MLSSFLLSLREGLEAALVLGIVLGTLRKIRRTELNRSVWNGALSAAALSLAIALALHRFNASLEGRAEEIFEGVIMLLAAGVLTWMIFWMHRQASYLKTELESGTRQAAQENSGKALFLLAFTAVLREGIELALFLTAAAVATDAAQTLGGALLGLGAAALVSWLLFATTIRLDLRRFFLVTGAFLILVAAGLVAHGVHELNEAGWIPPVIEHVWDMNFLLSEETLAGETLKAVLGYNGNPSLTETLAYLGYFSLILLSLWYRASRQAEPQQAHVQR